MKGGAWCGKLLFDLGNYFFFFYFHLVVAPFSHHRSLVI